MCCSLTILDKDVDIFINQIVYINIRISILLDYPMSKNRYLSNSNSGKITITVQAE